MQKEENDIRKKAEELPQAFYNVKSNQINQS